MESYYFEDIWFQKDGARSKFTNKSTPLLKEIFFRLTSKVGFIKAIYKQLLRMNVLMWPREKNYFNAKM